MDLPASLPLIALGVAGYAAFVLIIYFLSVKFLSQKARDRLVATGGGTLGCLGVLLLMAIPMLPAYFLMNAGGVEAETGSTDSMEIVHIALENGPRLAIPKAYLHQKDLWKGGEQEYVQVIARAADLKPRTGPRPADYANTEVHIYLEGTGLAAGDPVDNPKIAELEQLRPYLAATNFGISQLTDKYFKERDAGKSLPGYYFREGAEDDVEFYIAAINGFRTVEYECRASCSTETVFTPQLQGNYTVPRGMVPAKWQEIDRKVVALVESFVEKGEAAKK
jgi:hypothetical protein